MDAEVRWNSGDFERVRSLLRISMRPPRAGAVQVDHPLRPVKPRRNDLDGALTGQAAIRSPCSASAC
jgi:hypothetical protein